MINMANIVFSYLISSSALQSVPPHTMICYRNDANNYMETICILFEI